MLSGELEAEFLMTRGCSVITAADQRLNLSTCHAVNNRKLVAVYCCDQKTTTCNLSIILKLDHRLIKAGTAGGKYKTRKCELAKWQKRQRING